MAQLDETPLPPDFLNDSTTWVTVTEIILDIVPESIYSTEIVIVLSVVIGIVILLTVVGNLVVVVAYATTPKLRTYNNYFIVGLAILDLLVGVINMPLFAMVIILGWWPLGIIFCDIFSFLEHAFTHASIILVSMISLDRCIAVSYPLRHRLSWRRRSRAILIIAISYIIPIIMWLPMTTLWHIIHGIDERSFPAEVCKPLYADSVQAGFLVIVLFGGIPFTCTTILCVRIYFVIRRFYSNRKKMKIAFGDATPAKTGAPLKDSEESATRTSLSKARTTEADEDVAVENKKHQGSAEHKQANPVEGGSKKNKTQGIAKETIKGARTLAFIVAAMWIAWIPSLLVTTISPFCLDCVPGVVYSAAIFWGYMNSLLNPICYALADEAFKNSFTRILTFRCLTSDKGNNF